MRTIPILAASFLLLSALPGWPVEKGITLEQLCARSDLVVLGTLRSVKPASGKADANGRYPIFADLDVKEVLYGREPSAPIVITWEDPEHRECPHIDHTKTIGVTMIWCLWRSPDGTWSADNSQCPQPLDKRAAVEKAVQERLKPDLEILERSPAVDAYHLLQCWNGHLLLSPAGEAYDRLYAAGPAAALGARTLLRHERPVARAWGCLLLQTDVKSLLPMLDDAGIVPIDLDGMESIGEWRKGATLSVGKLVLRILGVLAGKELKTAEEARAWAESLKKPGPTPPSSP